MMAEFDRVVTDPRLHLDDLRAHLAGTDPSQSFRGAFRWRRPRAQPVAARSSRSLTTRPLHGVRCPGDP
jgi:hypothetical protein